MNGTGLIDGNPLGRALYSAMHEAPDRPVNICRFVLLDRRGPEFFIDWDSAVSQCVAVLRAHAGHDPDDKSSPTSSRNS